MALEVCRVCETLVSSDAIACPGCGARLPMRVVRYPARSGSPRMLILILTAILGLVTGLLGLYLLY